MKFQINNGDITNIQCDDHLQSLALQVFLRLRDIKYTHMQTPNTIRLSLRKTKLSVEQIKNGANRIMESTALESSSSRQPDGAT